MTRKLMVDIDTIPPSDSEAVDYDKMSIVNSTGKQGRLPAYTEPADTTEPDGEILYLDELSGATFNDDVKDAPDGDVETEPSNPNTAITQPTVSPTRNVGTSKSKVSKPAGYVSPTEMSPTNMKVVSQHLERKIAPSGNRSIGHSSNLRYNGELNASDFTASNILDAVLMCNPPQIGLVNDRFPYTFQRHEECHFLIAKGIGFIESSTLKCAEKEVYKQAGWYPNWGKVPFCAAGLSFAAKNCGLSGMNDAFAWNLSSGGSIEIDVRNDCPSGKISRTIQEQLNAISEWQGGIISRLKVDTVKKVRTGHVYLIIGVQVDEADDVVAFYTVQFNTIVQGRSSSRDGGELALKVLTVKDIALSMAGGINAGPVPEMFWRFKDIGASSTGQYCSGGMLSGPDTELVNSIIQRSNNGDSKIVQRSGLKSILQICA